MKYCVKLSNIQPFDYSFIFHSLSQSKAYSSYFLQFIFKQLECLITDFFDMKFIDLFFALFETSFKAFFLAKKNNNFEQINIFLETEFAKKTETNYQFIYLRKKHTRY